MDDSNIPMMFSFGEKAKEDAFNTLKVIYTHPDKEDILKQMENEYLRQRFSWTEDAKDSRGEWKRQRFTTDAHWEPELQHRGIRYRPSKSAGKLSVETLPGGYVTARSVLDRAAEMGVDFTLGKSAMERELRAPKTAEERALAAAYALVNMWPNTNSGVQGQVRGILLDSGVI